MKKVLILGGAGFLGSRIAHECLARKHTVTVMDGLVARTGGRRANLQPILPKIYFIDRKIESVEDFSQRLLESDVVVDCMAWTSHLEALQSPLTDLELNQTSHLHVIQTLAKILHSSTSPPRLPRFIYLGTRSQYGPLEETDETEISETSATYPNDFQGVHKLAAEHYYRMASRMWDLRVLSLRLPNCFGPHLPVQGKDIGLIAEMIRTLLAGKTVDVFGTGRRRNILFSEDLADWIGQLLDGEWAGFTALNLPGRYVAIEELAAGLVKAVGKGSTTVKEMPRKIALIEPQDRPLSDRKLKEFAGKMGFSIRLTGLEESLKQTVQYFKDNLNDRPV